MRHGSRAQRRRALGYSSKLQTVARDVEALVAASPDEKVERTLTRTLALNPHPNQSPDPDPNPNPNPDPDPDPDPDPSPRPTKRCS